MTQNPRVEMKPEQNIHIFLHKRIKIFWGILALFCRTRRRRRFPELPACLLPPFLSSPIGCGNAAEEEAAAAAAAVAAAAEKGKEEKPRKASVEESFLATSGLKAEWKGKRFLGARFWAVKVAFG